MKRALAACAALALLAAAQTPPRPVVVGSKNFPESKLLGEMMRAVVEEETGLPVEHRAGLGGTLVCFEGLRAGQLDLYAEYTGTAWAVLLKEAEPASDPLRVFLGVERRMRTEHGLELLAPFGLDNTYVLAMERERAAALGVRAISDLAAHAGELRAGLSLEFLNREDGWPGLSAAYGLEALEVRGMEHGLAYQALAEGEIDLVDAYSTDGKLLRYDLRLLEDDRGFFPPYHAAPLVRGALLAAHPEVGAALARLAYQVSDEEMARLNLQVEEQGADAVTAVARAFLRSKGLLAAGGDAAPAAARPEGFARFFLARWRETLRLAWEHVLMTLAAVALAALVAIPGGVLLARRPMGQRLALGATGVVQTVPSLALLAFMIAVPGLGLSARSAILALFLYALLPILRNTCTGLAGVDADLIDAARGMGLTRRQILLRVQLPLATATIMAGVRTATVISVGVATLAAFIGAGGLGEPIVTGLSLNDTRLILSGALPAALLALLADHGLGRLEGWLRPAGLA